MYEARIYINDRYQFLASDEDQVAALEKALPIVKPEFRSEVQSMSANKWREIGSLGIDFLSNQNADLLAALEGAFPLAIAHAAVYQITNELPDLHPIHGEIIQNAKAAIAKAKGNQS